MWKERLFSTLKDLSSRERDIITRRYTLDWGKGHPEVGWHGRELAVGGETLASIGRSYAITRERVRQLETAIVQKIKSVLSDSHKNFQPLEDDALAILKALGGAAEESIFFEKLLGMNAARFSDWTPSDFCERQAVCFIFEHYPGRSLERLDSSEDFYPIWKGANIPWADFKKNLLAIIKMVALREKPIPEEELFSLIREVVPQVPVTKEVVSNWLAMLRRVDRNTLGQWGLTSWSQIVPRRIGDKVDIVFQREKRPLHFRDITRLINELSIDKKIASEGSVRNELIASSQYVLIGRGIYALSSWGYRAGTVKEIIERIIRDSRRPLPKAEIMTMVLKERMVKETTVQAVLSNKSWFEKLPGGVYSVK